MTAVRRVVTGHDHDGKAVFAADGVAQPIMPGVPIWVLWGTDSTPTFPDAGVAHPFTTYFPPLGGFRFSLVRLPAGTRHPAPEPEPAARDAENQFVLPFTDLVAYMEPDEPGMHRTPTMDLCLVLEGTVGLELDGGAETVLNPGDVVIQNGTRHRWHNRGAQNAVIVSFMVGARTRTIDEED